MWPTSAGGLPSPAAISASPLMLEVLPWSVAMPSVVQRLRCSTECIPSRRASAISDAVTSFWKSTNALPRPAGGGGSAPGRRGGRSGGAGGADASKPSSPAKAAPASAPSAMQPSRSNRPDAAPTDRSACAERPGTNVCNPSAQRSVPRDWLKRCTAGFQPPLMAIRSQAIRRVAPSDSTSMPVTARRPRVRRGTAPRSTGRPSASAALSARRSTSAATSPPCRANARAAA